MQWSYRRALRRKRRPAAAQVCEADLLAAGDGMPAGAAVVGVYRFVDREHANVDACVLGLLTMGISAVSYALFDAAAILRVTLQELIRKRGKL